MPLATRRSRSDSFPSSITCSPFSFNSRPSRPFVKVVKSFPFSTVLRTLPPPPCFLPDKALSFVSFSLCGFMMLFLFFPSRTSFIPALIASSFFYPFETNGIPFSLSSEKFLFMVMMPFFGLLISEWNILPPFRQFLPLPYLQIERLSYELLLGFEVC